MSRNHIYIFILKKIETNKYIDPKFKNHFLINKLNFLKQCSNNIYFEIYNFIEV